MEIIFVEKNTKCLHSLEIIFIYILYELFHYTVLLCKITYFFVSIYEKLGVLFNALVCISRRIFTSFVTFINFCPCHFIFLSFWNNLWFNSSLIHDPSLLKRFILEILVHSLFLELSVYEEFASHV